MFYKTVSVSWPKGARMNFLSKQFVELLRVVTGLDLKVTFRIFFSKRVLFVSQLSCWRRGVTLHDFLVLNRRHAAIFWASCRGQRKHSERPERSRFSIDRRIRTEDMLKGLVRSNGMWSRILARNRTWNAAADVDFRISFLMGKVSSSILHQNS